jgi:hypothetical protein
MSLVTPGKYAAYPERLCEEKFADVYESPKSGNLVICMAFRLEGSGHVLKHWSALTQDGGPRMKTVEDLKGRFGWDGVDPWWFETADLSHVEVELVIEDEPDSNDPNKKWSRIKWVNTPGGRGGNYEARGDKRQLSAKYSSLFRAVAGPQPVKTAAKPPAAPPAKKPPAAPPAPVAPTEDSTLQDCWGALCEAMGGESQDEMTKNWFAIHEEVVPGKTQDDFSPADWGRVMGRIRKMAKALDSLAF